MKAGAAHRVPLSDAAMAIVEKQLDTRGASPYVFPGPNRNGSGIIGASTLQKLLQRECGPVTVHGFRSSFRTWAGERSNSTRDIAEMCLAHIVGSDIELSYVRSDLFEKRRALMDSWAAYVAGTPRGNVVAFSA
jgi:integrase